MKKRYFLLFIAICVIGCIGCRHCSASSSFLKKKSIIILRQEYSVRSPKNIKKLDLPFRNIPDKNNAAIEYIEAINLYSRESATIQKVYDYVLHNRWLPEENDFVQWFESNRNCIEALKKAITKKDCQFPILGTEDEMLCETLLPHISPFRALARLLAIEGKKYEYEGKYDEALNNYLALYKMRKDISKDPFLLSHIIGIDCQCIGDNAIEICLANHNLSASTLKEFIQRSESARKGQPKFVDSLAGEKANALDIVEWSVKRPSRVKKFLTMLITVPEMEPTVSPAEATKIVSLIAQREKKLKTLIHTHFKLLKMFNKSPVWETLTIEEELDELSKDIPILCMFLRTGSDAKKRFVTADAQSEGIRIVAAIKLYQKENGSYPVTLQELKRKYLKKLPLDPYSGELFSYRADSQGWILYSVGENLVDDGGMGSYPHKWKTDEDIPDKDIVFKSDTIEYESFE